jgi:hypothetical protein
MRSAARVDTSANYSVARSRFVTLRSQLRPPAARRRIYGRSRSGQRDILTALPETLPRPWYAWSARSALGHRAQISIRTLATLQPPPTTHVSPRRFDMVRRPRTNPGDLYIEIFNIAAPKQFGTTTTDWHYKNSAGASRRRLCISNPTGSTVSIPAFSRR